MIPLWWKWAVLGVALGLVWWGIVGILSAREQRGYDRAVAEYNVKLLAAQTTAREREQELLGRVTAAQEENANRERQIAALAGAVAKSSASLRDTVAAYSNSLSGASADSLRGSVALLGGLLDLCADRYRGMAREAERELSAKQTLIEAWPREVRQTGQ